tara:strand:- start:7216 stop:7452 length:237 start_codon:yes stop_codon:yes gene_type:complete
LKITAVSHQALKIKDASSKAITSYGMKMPGMNGGGSAYVLHTSYIVDTRSLIFKIMALISIGRFEYETLLNEKEYVFM